MSGYFLLPDYIHVTLQYSNVVLLAVLPHISDFCQKADIEVRTPITAEQVVKFHCSADRNDPGGTVLLTNGDSFGFAGGIVTSFCDYRHGFFVNDTLGRAQEFFGHVNISKDSALDFARQFARKIGYDVADLFADGKPYLFWDPMKIGTNVVPYYTIAWKDPGGLDSYRVEIDANHKRITWLSLSPSTWPGPLQINSTAESLEPREVPIFKRGVPVIEGPSRSKAASRELTLGERQEWVESSLLCISNFAKALPQHDLGPITTNVVAYFDIKSHRIFLTNGYEFRVERGYIQSFKAPAALWAGFLNGHASQYWGAWNMNADEAVQMARNMLSRLGYWKKPYFFERMPQIRRAPVTAGHTIPRFAIGWAEGQSYAGIEIDAATKSVRSFSCYQ